MPASARTTLLLNPALVKRAKQLALDRGTTLGAIVNEALEESLSDKRQAKARPFKVEPMSLGLRADTPRRMWEILEEGDLESVRR